MRGFNDITLSGLLAIVSTGAFAVIEVCFAIAGHSSFVGLEIVAPYLFSSLSLFFAYSFSRTETLRKKAEEIIAMPTPGIAVIRGSSRFCQELAEETLRAESVCTINLSPPRGANPDLDVYFARLHRDLSSKNGRIRSFRSIAGLDSQQKARWVAERAMELLTSDCASFAVFDTESLSASSLQLCFHICNKDAYYVSFLYPPVDLSGTMVALKITSEHVGRLFEEYFNTLWAVVPKIKVGSAIVQSGLDVLVRLDPSIASFAPYSSLRSASQPSAPLMEERENREGISRTSLVKRIPNRDPDNGS